MRRTIKPVRMRNAGILAASVLVHGGLFLALGLQAPSLRLSEREEEPPIEVFLPRTPSPPRETPREAPLADEARTRTAPAPQARPRTVSPLAPEATVAPLPMAPAAPAPGGAGQGRDRGRAATEFPDNRGEVTAILRGSPVGCNSADLVKLTAREREKCYERTGAMARTGGPVAAPIDADKRARFDRTAAKKERDRKWRESETVPVGTQEGRPGMPAGLGGEADVSIPIP